MKLAYRRGVALLAAVQLVGCGYWQGQPSGPREVLTEMNAGHVRLTRTNGDQIVARVVEVRGDSIFGTRGSEGNLSCERASESCNLQLPVSEVGFVEMRRFSVIKTAALFLVPIGVVAVVLARSSGCSGASAGVC